MKICLLGIPDIPRGKHNLKDPRLDQADQLVEARKKTYAQVDVVHEEDLLDADAIVAHRDHFHDLILQDLAFVESRLERAASDVERAALLKLKTHLEHEGTVGGAGLSEAESRALAVHTFHTAKPVLVAHNGELSDLDTLLLRAFRDGGYISYLTVGGKENRAWPIRKGSTAWEAAGRIHTDMQKGFIRAEVISFDDFVLAGGETQAKRAGKQRLETRTYLMQDYDVVSFRFNK